MRYYYSLTRTYDGIDQIVRGEQPSLPMDIFKETEYIKHDAKTNENSDYWLLTDRYSNESDFATYADARDVYDVIVSEGIAEKLYNL